MFNMRVKKIFHDLYEYKGRSLLTMFGITLGLTGASAVFVALIILGDDMRQNYEQTNPANITISTKHLSEKILSDIKSIPGVSDISQRSINVGRAEITFGGRKTIIVNAVENFDNLNIAKFYPEKGDWPPATGEMLIERDGKFFVRDPIGSSLKIRLSNGRNIKAKLSGYTFDPGKAPSRMEGIIYSYVSQQTFNNWFPNNKNMQLLITTDVNAENIGVPLQKASNVNPDNEDHTFSEHEDNINNSLLRPEDIVIAESIKTILTSNGYPIHNTTIRNVNVQPHQFQMDSIVITLIGIATICLIMCQSLVVNLIDAIIIRETKIIGTLKAIGASTRSLTFDYLLSMGVLGLLAGLISLTTAIYLGQIIALNVAANLNFNILTKGVHSALYVLVIVFSVAIPVLSAWLPVRRGAKMTVHDALQNTDVKVDGKFWHIIGNINLPISLPAQLALRNIFRKPKRLLLTLTSLSIGLTFFIATLNVSYSLQKTSSVIVESNPHDLAVSFAKPYSITSIEKWLSKFDNLKSTEYWLSTKVLMQTNNGLISNSMSILGTSEDTKAIVPKILAGRWLDTEVPNGIVVNRETLKSNKFLKLGESYNMVLGKNKKVVSIIGVVDKLAGSTVYTNRELVEELMQIKGISNNIYLTLEDNHFLKVGDFSNNLESSLPDESWSILNIVRSKLLQLIIDNHLAPISNLLLVVAGITLVIGIMGLATSVILSIFERSREIAVMKSIGGQGFHIAQQLILESVFIAILSWLIAITLAHPLSQWTTKALGEMIVNYGFVYHSNYSGFALALGIAIVVTIIASIFPTISAIRKPVNHVLQAL